MFVHVCVCGGGQKDMFVCTCVHVCVSVCVHVCECLCVCVCAFLCGYECECVVVSVSVWL